MPNDNAGRGGGFGVMWQPPETEEAKNARIARERAARIATEEGAAAGQREAERLELERVKRAENLENAKKQIQLDQTRAERDKDLAEGRARGEQEFGEGSLGRIDYKRADEIKDLIAEREKRYASEGLDANRSGQTADIISRRLAESQGFTAEEQNLMRERNLATINQGAQGNLRALLTAQGANGIRGNRAVLQQTKLMSDQQGQLANQERELALAQIDARRQGMDKYENSVNTAQADELGKLKYNQELKNANLGALEKTLGEARADELARTQFNFDQQGREKLGKTAYEMGYGSLGSADRGAILQAIIGEKQAAASANQGGGGGKK